MNIKEIRHYLGPQLKAAESQVSMLSGLLAVVEQLEKQSLVEKTKEKWANDLRQVEAEAKERKQRIDFELNEYRKAAENKRGNINRDLQAEQKKANTAIQELNGSIVDLRDELATVKTDLERVMSERTRVLGVIAKVKDQNRAVLQQIGCY